MAVSIPISANPEGVVRSLDAIRAALKRAGEDGKDFAQINLAHPELRQFANDLIQVNANIQRLHGLAVGTTAANARRIQQITGQTPWQTWMNPGLQQAVQQGLTSPGLQQGFVARGGSYVFQGTRFAPPPAAPPAAGGGGGGSGAGGAAGALGGAFGMVKPFAIATLAMAGIGSIKQVLSQMLQQGTQESLGADATYRRGAPGATDFISLRDAIRQTSDAFKLNYVEAQRLAVTWARMTNDGSPAAITAGIRLGAGFSRAYGLEPETGTQGLGRASFLGMDPEKFAGLIAEAAQQGGQTGQVEQVMQSLLRWSESAARLLVTHTNMVEFAGMYAGLNATGLPGFKGENAANFIETINANVMRGGAAGAASLALNYRAGAAMGVTDPYELRYLQAGGMFASPAADLGHGSTMTVFEAQRAAIDQMYPGRPGQPNYRRWNALANHFGINERQAMALDTSFRGNADLGATNRALTAANLRMQDVNPGAIRDLAAISSADTEGLEGWRRNLMSRVMGPNALSIDERKQLAGASGEDLRTLMVQMVARHGLEETEGSRTRDATVTLTNAMTKVGADLVEALNPVKTGLGEVGKALGDLTSTLKDTYLAARGDPEAQKRLMGAQADALAQGYRPTDAMRPGGGPGTFFRGERNVVNDAKAKERARQAIEYFQTPEGGNWSRAQAVGIAQQAGSESGFDPTSRGDYVNGQPQAVGLFQWHPDRQRAIENHYFAKYGNRKAVSEMSYAEQLEMKAWELSSEGPEAAAGARLRGETTAYGAGYSESYYDERPSGGMLRAAGRGIGAMNLDRQVPPTPSVMRIQPLEVIHRDAAGNLLGREQLPVQTDVTPAEPWGSAPLFIPGVPLPR